MLIERKFTLADFTPHVGGRFVVRPHPQIREPNEEEWQAEIELVEAEDQTVHYGGIAQGAARDPFVLLFRGGKEILLPNRICRLTHPALGEFDLFLTPVQTGRVHPTQAEFFYYETVFN